MEEFLLRSLFAGNELDIVHQEDVHGAVSIFKIIYTTSAYGLDEFVRKTFAGDVSNNSFLVRLEDVVADGLQEMGFSKSGAPVDE